MYNIHELRAATKPQNCIQLRFSHSSDNLELFLLTCSVCAYVPNEWIVYYLTTIPLNRFEHLNAFHSNSQLKTPA